jgi:hypothetical protein
MQWISLLLVLVIGLFPGNLHAGSLNLMARTDACPIPAVPDGAELVYLGMFRGRAAATVDLATRGLTGVADVDIETGATPIYLITASTGGMILRFSGHVERLTNVVSVGWFGMGFAGIGGDRAVWREGINCGIRGWDPTARGFQGPNGGKWGTAAEQIAYVEALAGRPVDTKVVERSFSLISIPSGQLLERDSIPGQMTLNVEGGDGFVSEDFLRAYPDGLIKISPEEVVSALPVHPLTTVKLSR